jgi:hypothetical protein
MNEPSTDISEGFERQRSALIRAIHEAFRHVRREDGVTLHEAHLELTGSERQRLRARARDVDTHWTEVSADAMASRSSVFSFFDEKGFRYYLPAYMTWTLNNLRDCTSVAPEMLLYALREPKLISFDIFDDRQSTAILRFLQFVAMHAADFGDDFLGEAAQEAIDSYWSRFELDAE